MTTRNVCATILLAAGIIGLAFNPARAGSMPDSVIEDIRLQGKLALASIKHEQLASVRQDSRQALAAAREGPRPIEPFQLVAEHVKLQGHLAQWSIREHLLADIRSGQRAYALTADHLRHGAANLASANVGKPTLERGRDLLKAPRLDLPELLPAMFR